MTAKSPRVSRQTATSRGSVRGISSPSRTVTHPPPPHKSHMHPERETLQRAGETDASPARGFRKLAIEQMICHRTVRRDLNLIERSAWIGRPQLLIVPRATREGVKHIAAKSRIVQREQDRKS